ncbi:MAG: DUF362 domain-containing protein [Syntrophobacteraceae bacterium]|nr:DUF362 domain-containing protein [Syntrophobacteraceae bacterium]
MTQVLCRRASYEYGIVREVAFDVLDALGGREIQAGSRVLVKPNLLAPAAPDRAMLTHPLLVKATVEYALDRGARVLVADSQAMGSFGKILKESGIREALRGLDVECRELKNSVQVDVGEPFGRIDVAEDAVRSDVIINLPKLKTHSQMLLTLAVKNLFGCVVGLRKPQWHLRAGVDRERFAALLVRICATLKPVFNILDGVLAMEGPGPGKGGIPRQVGVIMASRDAFSLDAAVCRLLGIEADRLFTHAAALKSGLVAGAPEIVGDLPRVQGFQFPQMASTLFGPRLLHGLMRQHLIQRPVIDAESCRVCHDCARYCPAGAIGFQDRKAVFDYDQCIRCYCCLEVCPHGAMRAEEPRLGKMFNRIIRAR